MKKPCIAFIGMLLCATIGANENEFNRITFDKESGRLTTEAALRHYAQAAPGGELHVFTPHLSLGYSMGSHGFGARLPLTFALYTGDSEAINSFSYGFEDAQLSYDYSIRRGALNFFLGGFWSLPIKAPGDETEGSPVSPGSGRHGLGLSFSAHGIRDPVVWNLGFSYGVGLPSSESDSGIWEPGNIGLSAGITVLFNEVFGFRLNLHQQLRLPQAGGADAASFSASSSFSPEALVMGDDWHLRLRLDIYAHPLFAPTALGITYGYMFDLPARR
ncbi:MAG: hypothetical protein FWE09_03865 [Treponema sp.]|nr:hypothetical protein [Treponema sp.]